MTARLNTRRRHEDRDMPPACYGENLLSHRLHEGYCLLADDDLADLLDDPGAIEAGLLPNEEEIANWTR